MQTKIRAVDLSKALSKKHESDFFLTEVKNGPTGWNGSNVRMDAIAINKSWSKPCIYGYEIKVDRQDFLNDEKWPIYREQTHRFSFVCPKGLIQPDEVAEDVGLIWYNPETGSLYTRKKAPYRECEMSSGMLFYIIMNRLDSDRYPFFSSKQEYLEQYVADKAYKATLGNMVGTKLANEVDELNREKNNLRRELMDSKDKCDILDEIIKELNAAGFRTSKYSIKSDVEKVVKGNLPNSLKWPIESIIKQAKELESFISEKNALEEE